MKVKKELIHALVNAIQFASDQRAMELIRRGVIAPLLNALNIGDPIYILMILKAFNCLLRAGQEMSVQNQGYENLVKTEFENLNAQIMLE